MRLCWHVHLRSLVEQTVPQPRALAFSVGREQLLCRQQPLLTRS